jgi:hypothetical protein
MERNPFERERWREAGRPARAGLPARRRLPDLRPASPGQLALIGLGLSLVGVLVPALGMLTLLGVAALVVAGLSLFVRPRAQAMYWRGRRVELAGEPTWAERLYRMIYKR